MKKKLSLLLILFLVLPLFAIRKRKKDTKKKEGEKVEVSIISREEFDLLKADVKQLKEQFVLMEEAIKTSDRVNADIMKRINMIEERISRLEARFDELLLKISRGEGKEKGSTDLKEPTQEASCSFNAKEASELYKKGFDAYIKERYEEAMTYFKQYAEQYPESPLADNAIFWCGECYYRMNNYSAAIIWFEKILDQYPDSDKAPAALLELVNCYRKIGKYKEAQKYLSELKTRFPDSKEASSIK